MDTITLKSPAKLNLYLEVLDKRSDGYHNIETIFEKIALTDEITLKKIPQVGRISINCNVASLASPNNLAYKAARLLMENCRFKINSGIEIYINKRVPIGAGLGGGSSNAAMVLLGLNKLFELEFSRFELVEYSNLLGADVGFFVNSSAFALGKGRGDEIQPIDTDLKLWHLIVKPPIEVSTKEIYDGLTLTLTKKSGGVNLLLSAIENKDKNLLGDSLYNRLEEVTLHKYGIISEIKDILNRVGIKANIMTGSGPAVFGILDGKNEADKIREDLSSQYPEWEIFAVETFNRYAEIPGL